MATRYDLSQLRAQLEPDTNDATKLAATGKSQSSSTLRSTLHESPIKLDDAELVAMAMETRLTIDLSNAKLSARAGPARWQPLDSQDEFRVFTRHQSQRFDVLAVGLVPGCVAEILNVLQSNNSEQFAQQMGAIFEDQFRDGDILHRASTSGTQSAGTSDAKDGGATLAELTVKRVSFNKAHWLANCEEWCYVDAVYCSKHGGRYTVVEKFMTTMQIKDIMVDTSTSMNAFHDVVCAYLLHAGSEDPPEVSGDHSNQDEEDQQARLPRETRVHFYAEYQIPKQVGFSLTTSAFGKGRRRSVSASDKTIKQRLLKLAQSTSRLTVLVRRQRLGLQVLVDAARFLPPTNTPCKVCTRILLVAKICRVCGQSVCGDCAKKHERARQPRGCETLEITRVRVCAYCLDRIDHAEYANLTTSSVLGAHVVPDPIGGKTARATLKDLLEDALRTAPSPTRKTSVKSVIKYMLDQETVSHCRRGSNDSGLSSISTSPALTPTSSDLDYIRALDALELGDVVVRSDDHRSYQLDTSGSLAVPTPVPENEAARLEAVCQMSGSELSTVIELEILCTLAAREMGCNMSVISLIQQDMYYGVASNVPELCNALVPRTQAICAHTIMESQAPMLVPHPEADVRFSKFDSVDKFGVRFYCAFPLIGENDQVVGSMCCVNGESLKIRASQIAAFEKLASTASKVMRLETQRRCRKAAATSVTPP